jgi:L-amino acid N-acyltransferase YncA
MHLVTFRANLNVVVLDSHEESEECPTKFIIINFRRWLAFRWFYLRQQYQHPRSSGSGTNMAVLIKYLHGIQQAGITSFITFAYYETNNSVLPQHRR